MVPKELSAEMKRFVDDLEEFYLEHVDNRKPLSRQDDEIGVLFEAARGILRNKGKDIE